MQTEWRVLDENEVEILEKLLSFSIEIDNINLNKYQARTIDSYGSIELRSEVELIDKKDITLCASGIFNDGVSNEEYGPLVHILLFSYEKNLKELQIYKDDNTELKRDIVPNEIQQEM